MPLRPSRWPGPRRTLVSAHQRRGHPHRHIATSNEGPVVGRPVRHAIFRLVCGMDLRLHPCSVAPAAGHEKCGPNRPTPSGSSCNNAAPQCRGGQTAVSPGAQRSITSAAPRHQHRSGPPLRLGDSSRESGGHPALSRCRHRPVQYLNNILEQDHRAIKRRVKAQQRFRGFHAARRTIQGYEAMHMIRKGQARWVSGSDVWRQNQFINRLFEVAA